MPVRTFLEHDHAFGPEDISNLSAAFEAALSKLGLVDRTDPATMAVAKLIIEFAKQGDRARARERKPSARGMIRPRLAMIQARAGLARRRPG